MRYNESMSSSPSNSALAFTRLTGRLQKMLDAGETLPVHLCERWLLLTAQHPTANMPDTLLDTAYRASIQPGKVMPWERAWIQAYANLEQKLPMGGTWVTTAAHMRQGDTAWLHALWKDEPLRSSFLRSNLRYRDHLMSAALVSSTMVNYQDREQMQTALHRYGPWMLTSAWRSEALLGRLRLQDDILQHTLWLYCENSNDSVDDAKELEIHRHLNASPSSLGAALMFYVARQDNGAQMRHMAPIFSRPAPVGDSSLFFIGLTYLYESYQKNSHAEHAWNAAAIAWPQPCSMLELFVSLYENVDAARKDILTLAQSYDNASRDFGVALPSLE